MGGFSWIAGWGALLLSQICLVFPVSLSYLTLNCLTWYFDLQECHLMAVQLPENILVLFHCWSSQHMGKYPLFTGSRHLVREEVTFSRWWATASSASSRLVAPTLWWSTLTKATYRRKGLSQFTVPGHSPSQQVMQDLNLKQLLTSIHSQEQREINICLSCLIQSRTPKSGNGAYGFRLSLPSSRQSPTDMSSGQLDLESSF